MGSSDAVAQPRVSRVATVGLLVGLAAAFLIPLGNAWTGYAFSLGLAAVLLGLLSREHLRRDAHLAGVRLSMLAVVSGAVALLFATPAMVVSLPLLQAVPSS